MHELQVPDAQQARDVGCSRLLRDYGILEYFRTTINDEITTYYTKSNPKFQKIKNTHAWLERFSFLCEGWREGYDGACYRFRDRLQSTDGALLKFGVPYEGTRILLFAV